MAASLAVQVALVEVLRAAPAVSALVAGVWDHVPQNTTPPYVQLGEASETPWNSFGRTGAQVLAMPSVWAEGTEGYGPALEVVQAMDDVLDRTDALAPSLSAQGWRLVSCSGEQVETRRGADGEVREVVRRYRVLVQRA